MRSACLKHTVTFDLFGAYQGAASSRKIIGRNMKFAEPGALFQV
jgi:hypothetical protein